MVADTWSNTTSPHPITGGITPEPRITNTHFWRDNTRTTHHHHNHYGHPIHLAHMANIMIEGLEPPVLNNGSHVTGANKGTGRR